MSFPELTSLQADPFNTADGEGDKDKDQQDTQPDQPFYEYWNQRDFIRWMGARITESSDGHATAYFEAGDHHRGAGVGGRAVTGRSR